MSAAATVPYQAYKSKRNSRHANLHLVPNTTPPSAAAGPSPAETLTEIPPAIETPPVAETPVIPLVEPPATPSPSMSETPSKPAKRTSTFRHVRPTRVNPQKDVESPPITPLATNPATPPPATTPTPVPTTPTPPPPPSLSPAPVQPAPVAPKGSPAPYRPGFQPKGVYRPRTDEFLSHRQDALDAQHKRIERTKLDRRLDKLIALHFPSTNHQPQLPPNRRASSIFDFELSDFDLRRSVSDAWKGVLSSNIDEIRAAEQRITPWQHDSTVSKCPLCSASFHPLTNRKHHCRVCGQIICSLPTKRPQRPVPCSFLFIVDPETRTIEQVGESVDYGVKKRRSPNEKQSQSQQAEEDAEKILKGVRLCGDCKPVLLRRQYQQEAAASPVFTKLYDTFMLLEKELEESLPQFQELVLSLTSDPSAPVSPEVISLRKRLLDTFAQYDALSKRIRSLPAKPGSSQDRIQTAVFTRANLFLQKHMFPLQSLPKPNSKRSSKLIVEEEKEKVDPDSQLAHALQPLLEQEALLESFVEEAKAHRKFEDAKTLRANLREIREEIGRIVKAGAA